MYAFTVSKKKYLHFNSDNWTIIEEGKWVVVSLRNAVLSLWDGSVCIHHAWE